MNIKAICTDIDGTLLNKNREISARTINAFRKLPNDFPVILASSRMPAAMRHLQTDLQRLENPLICYNGGYVISSHHGTGSLQLLDSVMIPLNICTIIIEMVKNTGVHVSLYTEDEWYAPREDYWTEKEKMATKVNPTIKAPLEVLSDWALENKGAHKIMCMGDKPEIEVLFQKLKKEFDGELHLYRSKDTYIEIATKSISKASGLKLLLERNFNISMQEVMAFGDNYNDIELLEEVGFGVAVENARNEVKAVAKEITGKNTADGVAIIIEKYLH